MNHFSVCRPVPFNFQLSDLTLFSISLPLQVKAESLFSQSVIEEDPWVPSNDLMNESQGFVIRSLPIVTELPLLSKKDGFLRYVPLQYNHYYIDLRQTFEEYIKQFSSKTKSTIIRKVRKYAKHCGGSIPWKTYQNTNDIREFFELARKVSVKTYQERLFDSGIPDSEDFISNAESLAQDNSLRAYILFDGQRPISYLYCPVKEGVLVYDYLGYDPEYAKMSPGTVLQWLALEHLFEEKKFLYFDFTEGESEHKRLFATHKRKCANIFFIKQNFKNKTIVCGHIIMNSISKRFGSIFDKLGLKTKIKRYLRFGK